MKTIAYIILTLLLASCSQQKDNTGENDRRIRLNAGVNTVISKAPVTTGSFEATITGWETNGATPDYMKLPAWVSTPTTITFESTKTLELSGNPQYELDNSIKTFVTGWYPQGEPTNGTVGITSANGETDVMFANAVSGSLDNKIKESLSFQHLLTQFKFVVVNGGGWDTGKTLKSITIKAAQLPETLNISEGTITYKAAAPLPVPNISEQLITTTKTDTGDAVMIAPVTGNSLPLTIITGNNETSDITATTTDPNYERGKAYTVTITFNNKGIGVTATVTPWKEGSASGTVE